MVDKELHKMENDQDGKKGVEVDVEGEAPLHILKREDVQARKDVTICSLKNIYIFVKIRYRYITTKKKEIETVHENCSMSEKKM